MHEKNKNKQKKRNSPVITRVKINQTKLFFSDRYYSIVSKRTNLFSGKTVSSEPCVIPFFTFVTKWVVKIDVSHHVSFRFSILAFINDIILVEIISYTVRKTIYFIYQSLNHLFDYPSQYPLIHNKLSYTQP